MLLQIGNDQKGETDMAVFLCGFMGCGKSTVGVLLAKNLGCRLVDTDDMIVESEGMSIPEIFESKGEKYFRDLEKQVVARLSEGKAVVSCGGGTMLSEENALTARKKGTVVYIDTPFESCYERIKDDSNRPLAVSRTKEQLRELYDSRSDVYKKNSDCCVDGECSPMEIAAQIQNTVRIK